MSNPLCRYCGKPMQIESIEYTDIFYECFCEGYKKDVALQEEIRKLESQLRNKEEELKKYRDESMYSQKIKKAKDNISKLEEKFSRTWTG